MAQIIITTFGEPDIWICDENEAIIAELEEFMNTINMNNYNNFICTGGANIGHLALRKIIMTMKSWPEEDLKLKKKAENICRNIQRVFRHLRKPIESKALKAGVVSTIGRGIQDSFDRAGSLDAFFNLIINKYQSYSALHDKGERLVASQIAVTSEQKRLLTNGIVKQDTSSNLLDLLKDYWEIVNGKPCANNGRPYDSIGECYVSNALERLGIPYTQQVDTKAVFKTDSYHRCDFVLYSDDKRRGLILEIEMVSPKDGRDINTFSTRKSYVIKALKAYADYDKHCLQYEVINSDCSDKMLYERIKGFLKNGLVKYDLPSFEIPPKDCVLSYTMNQFNGYDLDDKQQLKDIISSYDGVSKMQGNAISGGNYPLYRFLKTNHRYFDEGVSEAKSIKSVEAHQRQAITRQRNYMTDDEHLEFLRQQDFNAVFDHPGLTYLNGKRGWQALFNAWIFKFEKNKALFDEFDIKTHPKRFKTNLLGKIPKKVYQAMKTEPELHI